MCAKPSQLDSLSATGDEGGGARAGLSVGSGSTDERQLPSLHIVTSDDALREKLCAMAQDGCRLVRGWHDQSHFLHAAPALSDAGVVVDYDAPGISPRAFLLALGRRAPHFTVLFVSRNTDATDAAAIVTHGAAEILALPIASSRLRDAVRDCVTNNHAPTRHAQAARCRAVVGALAPRERTVLAGMVAGRANKAIAHQLGVSQRTVEAYRASLMKKLGAASLAEAVQIALCAQSSPDRGRSLDS